MPTAVIQIDAALVRPRTVSFSENDGRNKKIRFSWKPSQAFHLFGSKFRDQRRLASSSSDIFRIYAWDKYNRSSIEENPEIYTFTPTSIQRG